MFGKFLAAPLAKGALVTIGLLALALAVVIWRANAISNDREAIRNALATEIAHHAVTRQSVDTLTGELAKLVEEGEIRRARLAEAMEQVQADTAPLKAAAEKIEREGLPDDYVGALKDTGI